MLWLCHARTGSPDERASVPANLDGEEFVAFARTTEFRTVIDPMLAAAGASVRIAFESSEIDTIRGLVGAGLGVAIIPERTSADSGEEVCPLEPRHSRTLGLAWSTERSLPESVVAFLNHSTEALFAGR